MVGLEIDSQLLLLSTLMVIYETLRAVVTKMLDTALRMEVV